MIQLTGIDLSIYLALLGAILLYFGKIVGSTKVEKYDKFACYLEGLFFSATFIFIPFLIAYHVKNWFRFPILVSGLIELLIWGALSWNLMANELLKRHELLADFKKRVKEKFKGIKGKDSSLEKLVKSKYAKTAVKSTFGLDYVDLNVLAHYTIPIKLFGNKGVLGIFSFLTILSDFWFYKSGELLLFGIALLFTVFIFTMLALAYGYDNAYYPPAKIYLVDGRIMGGKLLKFDEFIYLLKGNKKTFINADKVKYIEENLFKEKETQREGS